MKIKLTSVCADHQDKALLYTDILSASFSLADRGLTRGVGRH